MNYSDCATVLQGLTPLYATLIYLNSYSLKPLDHPNGEVEGSRRQMKRKSWWRRRRKVTGGEGFWYYAGSASLFFLELPVYWQSWWGTPFMARLFDQLHYVTNPTPLGLEFKSLLVDTTFLVKANTNRGIYSLVSCSAQILDIVCELDADLIVLGLCSHDPHFCPLVVQGRHPSYSITNYNLNSAASNLSTFTSSTSS